MISYLTYDITTHAWYPILHIAYDIIFNIWYHYFMYDILFYTMISHLKLWYHNKPCPYITWYRGLHHNCDITFVISQHKLWYHNQICDTIWPKDPDGRAAFKSMADLDPGHHKAQATRVSQSNKLSRFIIIRENRNYFLLHWRTHW